MGTNTFSNRIDWNLWRLKVHPRPMTFKVTVGWQWKVWQSSSSSAPEAAAFRKFLPPSGLESYGPLGSVMCVPVGSWMSYFCSVQVLFCAWLWLCEERREGGFFMSAWWVRKAFYAHVWVQTSLLKLRESSADFIARYSSGGTFIYRYVSSRLSWLGLGFWNIEQVKV